VSLQTPDSVRRLRRTLYAKAKSEPAYRFYLLYDKVYREDILLHAYRVSRATRGAPGVDGMRFEDIDAAGVEEWLAGLRRALQDKTYRPEPVRRVLIPKPDGGERPLGIPTIRDRVVQTAVKLILEPIFEADFDDSAYGYRPKRSAQDAVRAYTTRCATDTRMWSTPTCRNTSTPFRTRSCCRVSPAAWWTGRCCIS
jgi:RNA-directed DNA polymerase